MDGGKEEGGNQVCKYVYVRDQSRFLNKSRKDPIIS